MTSNKLKFTVHQFLVYKSDPIQNSIINFFSRIKLKNRLFLSIVAFTIDYCRLVQFAKIHLHSVVHLNSQQEFSFSFVTFVQILIEWDSKNNQKTEEKWKILGFMELGMKIKEIIMKNFEKKNQKTIDHWSIEKTIISSDYRSFQFPGADQSKWSIRKLCMIGITRMQNVQR